MVCAYIISYLSILRMQGNYHHRSISICIYIYIHILSYIYIYIIDIICIILTISRHHGKFADPLGAGQVLAEETGKPRAWPAMRNLDE